MPLFTGFYTSQVVGNPWDFFLNHQQIPQATANEMLPRIEGNSLDLSEEPAKGGGHRGESDGKGQGDQLRVQKHLRKFQHFSRYGTNKRSFGFDDVPSV